MPNFYSANFKGTIPPEIQSSPCAPTAAANIIAYRAKQGLSRLMPPLGKHKAEYGYLKLIEKLAYYMDTTKTGTFALNLINGIEHYIKDRGYIPELEWAGEHYTGKYKKKYYPNMEWMMGKILGPSDLLLWIGNYKYRQRSLKATEAHCATTAGFNRIYDELYLHDPAQKKKPVKVKMVESFNYKDHPPLSHLRPSELLMFYPNREVCDIAILEAALALEIRPK